MLDNLTKFKRRAYYLQILFRGNNMAEAIDYWKEPEWNDNAVTSKFFAESDFKILFPDYRSEYIKSVWEAVAEYLAQKKLTCELDLVKRTMTVATTDSTRDPFVIIKARDFLKLMSRNVPYMKARDIFRDDMFCEIVKIGGLVRNKERFARRRQRLIGPDGSTLKAIEILANCYVSVGGQTVSIIGPWKGIKKVRQIVIDCMNNIHPIYKLKTLMIERELSKREAMERQDWGPYLPHFKKNQKRRKPK